MNPTHRPFQLTIFALLAMALGCSPTETLETHFDSPPYGVHTAYEYRSDDHRQYIRHGTFTEYYRSGQKRAQGTYQDGRRHGPFKRWRENGLIRSVEEFDEGQRHGESHHYYPNGVLSRHEEYRRGLPHGDHKSWNADQTLVEYQEYRHGRLHGHSRDYYEDSGKPRTDYEYEDGLRHGEAFYWDDEGEEVHVIFVEGQRTDEPANGLESSDG